MGSKPEPRKRHWYMVSMQTLDNDDGERGPYKGVMYTDCMGNLNFENRISGIRHMRRPTLEFTSGEPMTFIGFVQVDDDLWVRQSWKILHIEVLEADDGRKEG
jgi:hypothetical protein